MVLETIYLDNNASTQPDPLVVDAVAAVLTDLYANPSSSHILGTQAVAAVSAAREKVAALVSCRPRDVIFTSDATESNNLASRGLWEFTRLEESQRDTVVVGATEHAAVLSAAKSLERWGAMSSLGPGERHHLQEASRGAIQVDQGWLRYGSVIPRPTLTAVQVVRP